VSPSRPPITNAQRGQFLRALLLAAFRKMFEVGCGVDITPWEADFIATNVDCPTHQFTPAQVKTIDRLIAKYAKQLAWFQ
jgi:hypothetical protein